jgi:hypothetical protein
MQNQEKSKWDEVYERKPEQLPWFGLEFHEQVNTFLNKLDKKDLLVVPGCGVGDSVHKLQEQGFENLLGTDISAKGVQVASERFPSISFKNIPTQNLAQEGLKDVNVLDWLNMHQVSPEDITGYLESVRDISKNVCLVWIYEPGQGEVKKSFVHKGNIYFHSPEMVSEIMTTQHKLMDSFEFVLGKNPHLPNTPTLYCVGQTYERKS